MLTRRRFLRNASLTAASSLGLTAGCYGDDEEIGYFLDTIDVVRFVNETEIDPIAFEKSYYVAPDPTAAKAYEWVTYNGLAERINNLRSALSSRNSTSTVVTPLCSRKERYCSSPP